MKILLVKLKYLYIQYAWISVIKKQNSNQNIKVEKLWYLLKLLTITIISLILVTFSAVLWNCKRIWNWNLDRNLIMDLLIMAIYKVLFESFIQF